MFLYLRINLRALACQQQFYTQLMRATLSSTYSIAKEAIYAKTSISTNNPLLRPVAKAFPNLRPNAFNTKYRHTAETPTDNMEGRYFIISSGHSAYHAIPLPISSSRYGLPCVMYPKYECAIGISLKSELHSANAPVIIRNFWFLPLVFTSTAVNTAASARVQTDPYPTGCCCQRIRRENPGLKAF